MYKADGAEATLLRFFVDGSREGAQLPPERELCLQLKISRGTLRKILDRLEAKGKIWRHIGRGTFVGRRPLEIARNLMEIADATHPLELLEFRLLLEPQIARLAAMRSTQNEIAYLWHCVQKGDAAEDDESYELWDAGLHRAIATATHNSLLVAAFESISQVRGLTSWGRLREMPLLQKSKWLEQHRGFVQAISDRDPDRAEHLARVHVEDVLRMFVAVPTGSRPDR